MSEVAMFSIGFVLALLTSMGALYLAFRRGLLSYPEGVGHRLGNKVPITGWIVCGSLGLIGIITVLVAQVWRPQLGLVVGLFAPLALLGILGGAPWTWLWGGRKRLGRALWLGALTLLVAFPLAELAATGFSLLLLALGKNVGMQLPVQLLLDAVAGKPLYFVGMLLGFVVLAPLCEEFLFRGLLQSWLRRYCRRSFAIVLTALLFAAAHFHPANGGANLTALSGVFVLGLFLGHLFERERTLWAPLALHSLFNALGVGLVLIVKT